MADGQAIPSFRPDGTVFDLADVGPDEIVWHEIAAALSRIARFNGRCPCPAYSVAQHCVMGADALETETGDPVLAGYFLLHDAHEALIGDITRPALALLEAILLHQHPRLRTGRAGPIHPLKAASDAAKKMIDEAVFRAAGLPVFDLMPVYRRKVAEMDERMLRAEGLALFGGAAAQHLPAPQLAPPRLTGAIRPWGPMKAEEAWLDRLYRYLGIDGRAAIPSRSGSGTDR